MKINLKTREEILKIREAGKILAECHGELASRIGPGMTTLEIDEWVEQYLAGRKATPEQKGYRGYPFATCASVNDVVCHGFPNHRQLQNGDIVTIDIVVNKNGWLADSAWSYRIGEVSGEADRLLTITHKALEKGIAQAVAGKRVGDISAAVQGVAREAGIGIVKPLIGHGIGRSMHEPPDVPNFGRAHTGPLLREGMVITVEPILTSGDTGAVLWDDDGWTIRTADGSLGGHYEHTIAITKGAPVVLTSL
ncbi:type I methionyl aminopeptidase [Paenibacillus woosongensis]|uniref:Methionine aminopeptidase n=1 Tax=Paenibacillus woosongensis TaxID=307580 RepID=A0A7X2Z440_9BACL|nr:type I methionyl aminopeptidase [Paenibacillus woosongensis]MUG46481.1 type I methionyl aminopeptidase [Paenibacillus woosongensis]